MSHNNSLARYLSNHKWIISRILLQTFEELYLHTAENLIRFDAPFLEVSWKREQGNWMEKAYAVSHGEWVTCLLIEVNTFVQCKVKKVNNFYFLSC